VQKTKEVVMRTLRAVVLGVVAGVALAPAAMAADLGGRPPRSIKDEPLPYAQPYTWTGLYIGAHVGYGWSDADWQFDATPGVSTSHDGRGWLGGGQIGYNWQSGALVFGLEADLTSSGIGGSTPCPNATFNCSHDVNWLASVRGRLGVTGNANRTLFYVTAGGAWAEIDYKAVNTATGAAFGTGFSDRHFGWVAGAGIEHMFTPNMSARVEYLYYGFDSVTAPAGTIGAGAAALDPTIRAVRFGLNFKF
jgi:outer membrane immunogenic protein